METQTCSPQRSATTILCQTTYDTSRGLLTMAQGLQSQHQSVFQVDQLIQLLLTEATSEMGLSGRVAVKKSFLMKGNREKRLRYAKLHKNQTEDQWEQILQHNESKFEIFNSNHHQYIWRRSREGYNSECQQLSVQHGGRRALNVLENYS